MTTAATLRAAWAKIEDPARWTQTVPARDLTGAPVRPDNQAAVCWCAIGALGFGMWLNPSDPACVALETAAMQLYGDYSARVNDTLGHDAVRRMYARAIELAEQEAP